MNIKLIKKHTRNIFIEIYVRGGSHNFRKNKYVFSPDGNKFISFRMCLNSE